MMLSFWLRNRREKWMVTHAATKIVPLLFLTEWILEFDHQHFWPFSRVRIETGWDVKCPPSSKRHRVCWYYSVPGSLPSHFICLQHHERGYGSRWKTYYRFDNIFRDTHPESIKEDPSSYITALNNKIAFCLRLKRLAVIPELLAKIKAIPRTYGLKEQNPMTIKLLLRTYNVELELYRDSEQYEKGIALVEEVRQFLTIITRSFSR